MGHNLREEVPAMYRKDIYEMIEFKEKRGELDVPVSYAEMARRCGCDYRTVKSAIEKLKSGAGNPAPRPRKPSKLDPHADLIKEKLDAGCKVSAIYHFLREKRGYDGGLTILKVFCKRHRDGRAAAAQIRFETVPGEQAQVDWKEDMALQSRSGGAVRFSVFLMVLGYSRAKYGILKLNYVSDKIGLFLMRVKLKQEFSCARQANSCGEKSEPKLFRDLVRPRQKRIGVGLGGGPV